MIRVRGMDKLFDLFKNTLHIPQVIDEIGKDDDVECFVNGRKIVCVGMDEFQTRMSSFSRVRSFLQRSQPPRHGLG